VRRQSKPRRTRCGRELVGIQKRVWERARETESGSRRRVGITIILMPFHIPFRNRSVASLMPMLTLLVLHQSSTDKPKRAKLSLHIIPRHPRLVQPSRIPIVHPPTQRLLLLRRVRLRCLSLTPPPAPWSHHAHPSACSRSPICVP
jgi:hypothetical protein